MDARRYIARGISALVAMLVTLGVLLATSPTAQAAISMATTYKSYSAHIRSGPSTAYAILRSVAPGGYSLGINCWVSGQSIAGPYATSSIWYTVEGGGYVSDAMIITGSNAPVTPMCGTSTAGYALPFPGGTTHKINQTYGAGTFSHSNAYNSTAVDWDANYGEAVVASAAGRISFEGWNGAAGITILGDHGNGNCTQYAHLSSSIVDRGWTVKKGQKIGTVGGSGYGNPRYYATHLHWAGVNCSTQTAKYVIPTAERGSSYPAGIFVTSRNFG